MVFKVGGFKKLLLELPSQQEYHNQHCEKGENRDNTGYSYWKANITIFLKLLVDVLQYINSEMWSMKTVGGIIWMASFLRGGKFSTLTYYEYRAKYAIHLVKSIHDVCRFV